MFFYGGLKQSVLCWTYPKNKGGTPMAERTVYILLTRSGTCFSRIIHMVTGDAYTHASISLEGPLGPFYSFGRKYPRLALPAGLVQESVPYSWRFSGEHVPCCLCALQVSEGAYRRLRRRLAGMYAMRAYYRYSLLGALACHFDRLFLRRRYYFCSQFVATLLQECGAADLPKDPALLRPMDLCGVKGLRVIYRGDLKSVVERWAA